jgi:hypothetical protein
MYVEHFQMCLKDSEREKLEEESKKAGFRNTSEFVRYVTIGEGRILNENIQKILQKLEGIENLLKEK